MNLTIVAINYLPEMGAAARRTANIAEELAHRGHQVRVITQLPCYPGHRVYAGHPRRPFSKENRDGVTVVRIHPFPCPRSSHLLRSLGEMWFAVWAMLATIASGSTDVVLATTPSMFVPFAGRLAALVRRARFVLEVRDLTWRYLVEPGNPVPSYVSMLELAIAHTARASSVVLCTNSAQCEQMVSLGVPANRCAVIPPIVDERMLEPLPCTKEQPSLTTVMYIGLIGRAQSLGVLVEAGRILKDDPSYRFVLVGDGPQRAHLQAVVRKDRISNVEFVGPVPPTEVRSYYRRADILYAQLDKHPANGTALPSKLLEYMSCQRPIVYGGCGPGAELVRQSGAGVVIEPDNPEDLVAAVRRLHSDRAFADECAKRGYAWVSRNHRCAPVVDRLLTVLATTP